MLKITNNKGLLWGTADKILEWVPNGNDVFHACLKQLPYIYIYIYTVPEKFQQSLIYVVSKRSWETESNIFILLMIQLYLVLLPEIMEYLSISTKRL